jgi:hypothetical protein
VTYSYLTGGTFNARLSPGGFIFDVAGSSIFPENINLLIAVLNSTLARYLLGLINPTVNFQVGDLARLPIPEHSSPELEQLVNQAIELAKTDSQEDETTYDFIAPPDWNGGIAQRQAQLAQIEQKIDSGVYQLYSISDSDIQAIETELGTNTSIPEEPEDPEESTNDEDSSDPLTPSELAHKWISYAFGIAIARFPHCKPATIHQH